MGVNVDEKLQGLTITKEDWDFWFYYVNGKEFSQFEAWVYILLEMESNGKASIIVSGRKTVFGWSSQKTKRYLENLDKWGKIILLKDRRVWKALRCNNGRG